MKTLQAADLFCGAGGTSTGLLAAAKSLGLTVDLLAVNHWDVAIATHTTNHPGARHLCADLESIDPLKVAPGGRLNLLVASPACTHHSRARGGKPMSDQQRASAWHILRWAEALYIDNILIENVREWQEWGPLGVNGRPLKSKRGELFQQFLRSVRALGYNVDYRLLNAADYGDATSRTRLFVQARRGGRRIQWPEPTHSARSEQPRMFETATWRPAREIIDWTIPSQSIYSRKRPLAPNTMRRIYAGLQKFSGRLFVIGQQSCAAPRGVNDPIPTAAAAGAISLIEPLATMTTSGTNFGLPPPFLVQYHSERVGEPARVASVDQPLPTQTTENRFGLAEPFLVSYYGTGTPQSVDAPLATLTTRDRLGLATPEIKAIDGQTVGWLDIHFRMLQPHELAAAMSFPTDYEFTGNRAQRVRQIGNAVAVRTAQALTGAILRDYVPRAKETEQAA